MKLLIVTFVSMGLLSCSHKNSNDKIITGQALIHSEQSLKEPADDIKEEEVRPNYDISQSVFNDLSLDLKTKFIDRHKDRLNKTLFSYYDRYSEISEIDSIFEILTSCDFSIKADKDLGSFYTYVLFEILKNNKVDGYVGESVTDVCFMLFYNHPGVFYQHIDLADEPTRESLINNVAIGLYYNDMADNELDIILGKQKQMLPGMEKQISIIGNDIKERYKKID